ncbi:D,D-heptose 1,7-bisphosphate phosphatase [Sulfurimonas gotlandica GD1]|jgi:D-glycero-D-manno-heptose 1,7-bisphosphate phosphatase|uniref:D,D-heptose 1,7-bisphosphate phosphatase n=1 Tax=Sulfurimonas gotlandica (strain DSM 19862 / JCM 16533 / GD1) TaxID=929558 RepID=B6BIV7_SULGG|nr:D-glycero-beta-D-manno-heptose 1,7-bisphosphate 7-phosphatase [Sulfurimonas gotlandica]EDZ62942.1 D,D-heptose 1,7-bisphosphate phosphatase [Sulfurimonas gotlandica GD1]EHP30467.1 D,D-heptose 1,7-bisphosphate phosphatase [Sulfurimonas gotlandica GD1]
MNKALFLDRDGVINIEKDYLFKIEDFEFIDGIFNLCNYYQKLGFIIIVVTNQSGIDRGYYTERDFDKLTDWMMNYFSSKGINLKKVYYCPHHPNISGECSCRKPNPGMLLKASEEFNIDLKNSIMIGDKERDVLAGINAGLTTTYLLDESKSVTVSKASKIVSKLEEVYSVNT